eukprot:PhM_4_TR12971/c0_g1_i1/m.63561/K21195/phnY; 2-aminoethylphosphonate dioxygenase
MSAVRNVIMIAAGFASILAVAYFIVAVAPPASAGAVAAPPVVVQGGGVDPAVVERLASSVEAASRVHSQLAKAISLLGDIASKTSAAVNNEKEAAPAPSIVMPPPQVITIEKNGNSKDASTGGGGGGGVHLAGRYHGPHDLTYDELVSWHRDGFLVRRGVFSEAEVANITAALNENANAPDVPTSKGGKWKYFEKSLKQPGKRVLNRIERVCDNPKLWNVAHDRRIHGAVSAMLGEEAVLFKDKSNYKLPGGGRFEAHQDIQPKWDEYATQFISVLVTIDYNRKENGCLEVAGGHYGRGLIGRYFAAMNETETAGMKWVFVETTPGDVVFFDGRTPHKSGDNLSDKPRRNTYFTFNKRSEGNHRDRYYQDKYKTLPPDADREEGKNYHYKV